MAFLKKVKSGWKYRISYKDPMTQELKQKSKSGFATKKEAQLHAAKTKEKLEQGLNFSKDISFIDYFEEWYKTYKKDKFSPSYNKDVETAIEQARDYFGQTKLKNITKHVYQKFLNDFGQGRATSTVKKKHVFIGECLADAFHEGLIPKDPTYKVTITGTKDRYEEADMYLNYNEAIKLSEQLKQNLKPTYTSRYMILLALATGLRFSEIVGLAWDDIDFEQHTLSVNRMFDYRTSQQFQKPKSEKSKRTIALDKATIAWLKRYKLQVQKDYPKYVFMDKFGQHVSNSGVNKALKKACSKAGVKEITFHKLRHTHCSILLYKGINIKYISKRLGHSSTQITYEVYGHILDELDQQEAQRVDDIMAEITSAGVHN